MMTWILANWENILAVYGGVVVTGIANESIASGSVGEVSVAGSQNNS